MDNYVTARSAALEPVHHADRERRIQNSTEERSVGHENESTRSLLLENLESSPTDDDIPALHVLRREANEAAESRQERPNERNDCRFSNLDRAKMEYFEARPFEQIVKIDATHTVSRETQTASVMEILEAKFHAIFDFAIITVVFNIVVPFCGLIIFLRAIF